MLLLFTFSLLTNSAFSIIETDANIEIFCHIESYHNKAPLCIRRPPHPLTYTNINIKTGILTPISTDTDRLTKILYRNNTTYKS